MLIIRPVFPDRSWVRQKIVLFALWREPKEATSTTQASLNDKSVLVAWPKRVRKHFEKEKQKRNLSIENILRWFNREVGNEIYNHQLLFTFIKFYRIFHYWHKPTWKFLISCALTKAVVQIFFGKNTKSSSMVEYNFAKNTLWLTSNLQNLYHIMSVSTPWVFPGLFRNFSDQRFGLSIRFRPCLFPGEPESKRSV